MIPGIRYVRRMSLSGRAHPRGYYFEAQVRPSLELSWQARRPALILWDFAYEASWMNPPVSCQSFPRLQQFHSWLGFVSQCIFYPCLLYTSDAADDLLCVDLG